MKKQIQIKPAEEKDIPTILKFIRELAIFEKLEHEMIATPDLLKQHLFGKSPAAEVVFLEQDDEKVGFALFFPSFSTFLGQPGIYLEDLFVLPKRRGNGYGKMLLSHLAKIAVERGGGRLEWSVLDWNKPALDLYLSLGAKPMDEWTVHRMTGDNLLRLASLSFS